MTDNESVFGAALAQRVPAVKPRFTIRTWVLGRHEVVLWGTTGTGSPIVYWTLELSAGTTVAGARRLANALNDPLARQCLRETRPELKLPSEEVIRGNKLDPKSKTGD